MHRNNLNSEAKIELMAKVCHEAIKAFCEGHGYYFNKSWDEADEWQRDATIQSVKYRLENPGASLASQHDAWTADKIAHGWRYGEIKDTNAGTHPGMVPYDQLPKIEKQKDALFIAIIEALRPRDIEKKTIPLSLSYCGLTGCNGLQVFHLIAKVH